LLEYKKAFSLENIDQINALLYAALLNNRANVEMLLNGPNNVLDDLLYAQNIRDSLSQYHELNMSYLNIAEYYALSQDTVTALKYTYKAYDNALQIKNLLDEREALQRLILFDKDEQLKHNQEY